VAVDPSHPAVAKALAALSAEHLVPLTLVERGEMSAVVILQSRNQRYAVIAEKHDGDWAIPEVIPRISRYAPSERPATTEIPTPFLRLSQIQSGWPTPAGSPPEVSWRVLTGFAAKDAAVVIVRTDEDVYEASVGSDGFFVAFVRAPWRGILSAAVRTHDGHIVDVAL
jgi:hypothetical protein